MRKARTRQVDASPARGSDKRRGLACMLAACLLFSIMTVCVYAAALCQPSLPSTVVSFVRVMVNLAVLMAPALLSGRIRDLFGDGRASLWLRGLFGASALMLSFFSIQRIGPGESTFIGASSGVFVVLLSPWTLGQRNSGVVWFAIVGAFAGLFLLLKPEERDQADLVGRALALGSGFLAALAYLMVARAGRSNPPQSVIFYFCIVAVALHLAYFAYAGFVLPDSADVWLIMLLGGISASGAQHYMTRAYQLAPAALVSAVGYLSPVLSLLWSILLFSRTPGSNALVGCGLVLLCGVVLPFLTARRV
ncbi:DMT family transporter [Methyloterricola oryzae]|uniref:DMT family transporter n=1 Tax=Methyloterricola oryzae TaxID=1495050 RepID=UPI001F1D1E18|nr:DMT family transporter [Methyloterricola oryzae]